MNKARNVREPRYGSVKSMTFTLQNESPKVSELIIEQCCTFDIQT